MPKFRDDDLMLYVIGAHKSGTSWLYSYFAQHDEIFVPRQKELNFHYEGGAARPQLIGKRLYDALLQLENADDQGGPPDEDTLEHVRDLAMAAAILTGKQEPLSMFDGRADHHSVFADVTPAYATHDAAAFKAMSEAYPRTRFVFIMRDPVERLYSDLRYSLRATPDDLAPCGKRGTQIAKHYGNNRPKMRSDYKRTLTTMRETLESDQYNVFFFEWFFNANTLKKLTDFIGVSYKDAPFHEAKHVTKVGRDAVLTDEEIGRISALLADQYEFVDEMFDHDIPDRWKSNMHLGKQVAAAARS